MLATLQWYILRETGRTTLLTAIGLTAILSMGGGVLNIVDLGQVTAGQLLRLMVFVVPVAATLSLPVAAMFGAAATYGRLSADNEFVACRASGINILHLFLPAGLIAVMCAAVTLACVNYFMPGIIHKIDAIVRSDPGRLVKHAMSAPDRLVLPGAKNIRAYADDVVVPTSDGESTQVTLIRAAFLEVDQEGWSRCATAESATLRLEGQHASIDLHQVTWWDPRSGELASARAFPLVRGNLPKLKRSKIKWLTLDELLRFRLAPLGIPAVQRDLERLQREVIRGLVYRSVVRSAVRDPSGDLLIVLEDDSARYELRAKDGTTDAISSKPTFADVQLRKITTDELWTASAGEATIQVEPSADLSTLEVTLHLGSDVAITRSSTPQRVIRKNTEEFGPIRLPLPDRSEYAAERLIDLSQNLGLGTEIEGWRRQFIDKIGEARRDIDGVLHSRLAFSCSVIFLVLLAATLGIILRGSHLLTSFGISFIPSIFVTVMIIMGRQLAKNPSTGTLGLGVMWLGIALVALADLYAVTRILRR
ncbi:MAG: LptF/LptG family permease [Planctomycetes bacterium]|nr:LptF/LptG family permease [Planctomycetota bacterium]